MIKKPAKTPIYRAFRGKKFRRHFGDIFGDIGDTVAGFDIGIKTGILEP